MPEKQWSARLLDLSTEQKSQTCTGEAEANKAKEKAAATTPNFMTACLKGKEQVGKATARRQQSQEVQCQEEVRMERGGQEAGKQRKAGLLVCPVHVCVLGLID